MIHGTDGNGAPRHGLAAHECRPSRHWLLFIVMLFLAGLVLPVWWLVSAAPPGLPGLGAYPSAYLGDPLLLPVGCLVLLIGIRRLRAARREWLLAVVAALVALVSAVSVQAEWLEDPTTQPNWTMPHTGRFDAAGWWHAVYFTGMSMVLVVLTTVFLARVRADRRDGGRAATAVSSGTGAVAVLTAWGSYAALSVHDDFSGSVGSPSTISSFALVGVVLLLATGLTVAAYGRLAKVLSGPTLIAAAGIGVIDMLITGPVLGRIALGAVLAAAVAAGIGWYWRSERRLPGLRSRWPQRGPGEGTGGGEPPSGSASAAPGQPAAHARSGN